MASNLLRISTLLPVLGLGIVSTAHASLVNGSFELPVYGDTAYHTPIATDVPGWSTTAPDNKVEIWSNNYRGVPAYAGNQFAELNANYVSTLYQDVSGIGAGNIVGFQFAHRGRLGDDTMAFTLTDLGADGKYGTADDTVLFSQQYTDGNDAWGFYTGTGITALGNTVRFAYDSVSAAGGSRSVGNFLDAADFGVGVGSNVPEPSSFALAGIGLLGLAWGRRSRQSR